VAVDGAAALTMALRILCPLRRWFGDVIPGRGWDENGIGHSVPSIMIKSLTTTSQGSGARGLHRGDHPSLGRDENRQRSKSSSALRALVRTEALARAGSSTTKAVVPRYAVFSQLAAVPL
jgi:hypothetical protein